MSSATSTGVPTSVCAATVVTGAVRYTGGGAPEARLPAIPIVIASLHPVSVGRRTPTLPGLSRFANEVVLDSTRADKAQKQKSYQGFYFDS